MTPNEVYYQIVCFALVASVRQNNLKTLSENNIKYSIIHGLSWGGGGSTLCFKSTEGTILFEGKKL